MLSLSRAACQAGISELAGLQERYRELSTKEIQNHKDLNECEINLKKKTDELDEAHRNSNNLVKMLKDNSFSDQKVKDLILKKEHYKNKVNFYLKFYIKYNRNF